MAVFHAKDALNMDGRANSRFWQGSRESFVLTSHGLTPISFGRHLANFSSGHERYKRISRKLFNDQDTWSRY